MRGVLAAQRPPAGPGRAQRPRTKRGAKAVHLREGRRDSPTPPPGNANFGERRPRPVPAGRLARPGPARPPQPPAGPAGGGAAPAARPPPPPSSRRARPGPALTFKRLDVAMIPPAGPPRPAAAPLPELGSVPPRPLPLYMAPGRPPARPDPRRRQ